MVSNGRPRWAIAATVALDSEAAKAWAFRSATSSGVESEGMTCSTGTRVSSVASQRRIASARLSLVRTATVVMFNCPEVSSRSAWVPVMSTTGVPLTSPSVS